MAESDPHPIAHVDPDQCHQWLREECASLAAARQAREDGIVATITQISSAALLGIPALLLSATVEVGASLGAILMYGGMFLFFMAISFAMAEQHFSSKAYDRQRELTIAYYTLQGTQQIDHAAVNVVRRFRRLACWTFAVAALTSTVSLFVLKGENYGRTSVSPDSGTVASSPPGSRTLAAG